MEKYGQMASHFVEDSCSTVDHFVHMQSSLLYQKCYFASIDLHIDTDMAYNITMCVSDL